MRTETLDLTSDSPGTTRTLTRHIWGQEGQGPKVYLQAALHADEMPGALAAWHLMGLLDQAEAEDRITGEIWVVPLANPIGLTQWLSDKPQGRREMDSSGNFNRGYPDLAALAGDALAEQLTDDGADNTRIIRAAFAAALAAETPQNQLDELRLRLLQGSHDADHVLDLHCDHVAVMHLYASTAQPETTDLLGRCTGAKLALIEDISGGNAFDEAHTAPWRVLQDRFPGHPIPAACFSTTLEYRGQRDVDDATGMLDAMGLMAFLGAVGAVKGASAPAHPPALETPLAGAGEAFAPQGGIVTWAHTPGDEVTEGDILGHVTDPTTRRRLPIVSPASGLMFRREMWPFCLKGHSLCHVAGTTIIRQGDLLAN
ncbi:MAG: succinylglutamate desuccinylase/aspartoacylase family protein [Paracoccaceae bacterium]